jgi:ribosomal protein S7
VYIRLNRREIVTVLIKTVQARTNKRSAVLKVVSQAGQRIGQKAKVNPREVFTTEILQVLSLKP